MARKVDIVDTKTGRQLMGPYSHHADKRQHWGGSTHIPRHRHTKSYAQLILTGGHHEYGSRGRITARPGDVLMHGAFDAHLNHIFVAGTEVLNLRVPGLVPTGQGFGRVGDPDTIVRAAEIDQAAAVALLQKQLIPQRSIPQDWPDLLAADILEDPNRRLDDWAEAHNFALETLSRGFGRVFGITPATFRAEVRSRKAFEQIVKGTNLLGQIMKSAGFADQAHMSRAIRSLTGSTPRSWLQRASFKGSVGFLTTNQ